jgi:hypothetical protein
MPAYYGLLESTENITAPKKKYVQKQKRPSRESAAFEVVGTLIDTIYQNPFAALAAEARSG